MTATAQGPERSETEILAELDAWLEENWDVDLSVAEWWQRLGQSGWAAPTWPVEWFGKGLARAVGNKVGKAIGEFGAVGPPAGLGMMLAGPTIIAHGTDEQKARLLEPIVTGTHAWCQLFSEPGAGSDLASVQTRAVRDGDEWIVNGQKVWTSGGQIADVGMLIARTDPELPKHSGITYFAIDMDQPGIDVRDLREMTGRSLFSEVFLEDARVADDAIVGELNGGWAAALTTLANEREGLGAGGGGAAGGAVPGTKAGMLERRVGDLAKKRRRGGGAGVPGMIGKAGTMLTEIAKENGKIEDASTRQDLMRLHSLTEIGRFATVRAKAEKAIGKRIPGDANISKLNMSRIVRLTRDVGIKILGPGGTLMGKESPTGGMVQELALFSPAVSIYGGTDQVQRNIIGERVLGLPKEPGPEKGTPFKDLKVGTQQA